MTGPRVGLVGGRGRMGQALRPMFEAADCRIKIIDVDSDDSEIDFIEHCEVIVLSVPLEAVEDAAAMIGPRARPDGLVMDLSSLKEEPVRSMLNHFPGEVIGCHPLFGPMGAQSGDRVVFYHPARVDNWLNWLKKLWISYGCRLVEISPTEHDKLMATVQVLRHLMIYAFGRTLDEFGYDRERNLDLSGPMFGALVNVLDRQQTQPVDLFAGIAAFNPHSEEVFSLFVQSAEEILKALKSGNMDTLAQCLDPKGKSAKSQYLTNY